jgi:hypothetical protein
MLPQHRLTHFFLPQDKFGLFSASLCLFLSKLYSAMHFLQLSGLYLEQRQNFFFFFIFGLLVTFLDMIAGETLGFTAWTFTEVGKAGSLVGVADFL